MSTEEKTTTQKMERIIIIRKKIRKLSIEQARLEKDVDKEISED